MDNLDVNKLLLALENVKNEELLKDDMKSLNQKKTDMIKTLHLSNKTNQELLNKLKHYRYVDELPDMKYGSYIRWINLRDPANLRLTNGGIIAFDEYESSSKGVPYHGETKAANEFAQQNQVVIDLTPIPHIKKILSKKNQI